VSGKPKTQEVNDEQSKRLEGRLCLGTPKHNRWKLALGNDLSEVTASVQTCMVCLVSL
jgi:hypothetical protein